MGVEVAAAHHGYEVWSSCRNVVSAAARCDGLDVGLLYSFTDKTDLTRTDSTSAAIHTLRNSWVTLSHMKAQRPRGCGAFSHVSLIWILVQLQRQQMANNSRRR